MLSALGIYIGIFTPSGFNCQYCPGSFGLFDFENKFEGDTSPRIEKLISDRLCKPQQGLLGAASIVSVLAACQYQWQTFT